MAKRELTQRHRPNQEGNPGAQRDSSIPEYLLQEPVSPASPETEGAADVPAAPPEPAIAQEEWEQIHFPCRYCSTEVQQNIVTGRISCPGCQREWENFDTCYEANPAVELPAAEQPGSSLDDILLSKLPGDGDLAITALQKALEDDEILENLANQIPNFHLPEIKEGAEKLLGKLKTVRNLVEKEVGHFKQQFQLEPPAIKELCSNCDFHKMKNSSTPGKLLAPHYHGKCTREGGFCDEVRVLMETPTLPEEPTPAQEYQQATGEIIRLKRDEGLSIRSIALQLKENGIRNDKGHFWSKSAIDRVIQQARKEGVQV
jgi:hypothetical protein